MILGLNAGGTNTTAVAGTTGGELVERVAWKTDVGRGPEPIIAEQIARLRELEQRHAPIERIGIAFPGPMVAPRGFIEGPPRWTGWVDFDYGARMRAAFTAPIHIEHDAAACAFAEYLWGDYAGADSLLYFTCGTGFGVGAVIGGRVIRGVGGASLEIGHARFAADGPTVFEKRGSVEAYCANSSLSWIAAWKFPSRWGSETPAPEALAALAVHDDGDAREVLRINAEAVGQVCADVADLFAPRAILLGTAARYLGASWVALVRATYEREVHPRLLTRTVLVPATLSETVQDRSALAAALTPS